MGSHTTRLTVTLTYACGICRERVTVDYSAFDVFHSLVLAHEETHDQGDNHDQDPTDPILTAPGPAEGEGETPDLIFTFHGRGE